MKDRQPGEPGSLALTATNPDTDRLMGRYARDDDRGISLGPCCACERYGPQVRNIIMLHVRGVVSGHGWGCFQCGLPQDGAVVVLCDDCMDQNRPIKFASRGYPASEGRIDINVLTVPFDHDENKHPELKVGHA